MNRKFFQLAAPSYVIPGTVGENCLVLKDKVREVGLTLFESAACLNYTDKDIPRELAGLNLGFHVHLPLDYDWTAGAEEVFSLTTRLLQKVQFLGPDKFVLHPPINEKALDIFASLWTNGVGSGRNGEIIASEHSGALKGQDLLVENIDENDLTGCWDVVCAKNLGVCLDLGHILAYNQWSLLDLPTLWERVRLLHVYGLEKDKKHYGLEELNEEGKELLRCILDRVRGGTTLVLEVFSLAEFVSSKRMLVDWLHSWGIELV
jgi:sugar phosphate isomerase/epimerase